MRNTPLQTALVEWIDGIFQEGIVLTEAVTRFMEATFGCRDVAGVLASENDSELDSFIDLLCYPDFDTQIRYESVWGNHNFDMDDQNEVIRQLCTEPRQTDIVSASGTILCAIMIPSFAVEAFVRRLNINRTIPAELSAKLALQAANAACLRIRVHLRNADLPWHADQIRLLDRYLSKTPADTENFEGGFTFLLSIISELMPGQDGFEFLIAKKFLYFQSLCRAEDFERKRLSSNMEIMMLQGERAVHGSIETWRTNMRQIDMICQAVFGSTRFFRQPAMQELDITGKCTARSIDDILRLLS